LGRAIKFVQLLINAVTVEVKSPKNQMSGFATNQELKLVAIHFDFLGGFFVCGLTLLRSPVGILVQQATMCTTTPPL
jgi:hypothetical protein